jgi:hypothetical protein
MFSVQLFSAERSLRAFYFFFLGDAGEESLKKIGCFLEVQKMA